MARAITNTQLQHIASMIRDWPDDENLYWDAICQGSKTIIGYEPTRQALSKKTILTNAYKIRKAEIKARHDDLAGTPRPKSMNSAVDQIIRLKKENARLKKELSAMSEMAQRFIHNASIHGLGRDQLMKPLMDVDHRE